MISLLHLANNFEGSGDHCHVQSVKTADGRGEGRAHRKEIP